MSRFNSFGTFVSGNGGQISYDGILAGGNIGTCASWLTDNLIVANVMLADGVFRVAMFDVWNRGAGWQLLDARGANALAAHMGHRWAGFTPQDGVFGWVNEAAAGLTLQGTDQRGAAAPDGTIGTVAQYQAGTGLQLHRMDGSVFDVPGVGVARQVQILDRDRAVWDDGAGNAGAWNVHVGRTLPVSRLRVADDWRVYYTGAWGVVAHPVDLPEQGRVITQLGFHHEAIVRGGQLFVGYSTGVQELPNEWVVADVLGVNADGTPKFPIVDLTSGGGQVTVPVIDRDLWLGFYVGSPEGPPGWFTDQSKTSCPGNAYLDVITSALYAKKGGRKIANFLHGAPIDGDIEAGMQRLEQQAASSPTNLPVIAYWDARNWPRKPTLPAHAWPTVQMYRHVNETVAAFKAAIIAEATRVATWFPDAFMVGVPQCYTSNAGQTQDLISIVPVAAEMCILDPWFIALIPFSGTGRKTGLQDHPEVHPYWMDLYHGITGEPTSGEPPMGNGIVNGQVVDPKAYFFSLIGFNEGDPAPADWKQRLKNVEPQMFKYGFGEQTDGNGGDAASDLRGRYFYPWASCPNAAPRAGDPVDQNLKVNQTPACCGIGDVPCGIIDVINREATHWIWNMQGPPYVPIPAPDAGPGPDPTPGDYSILIHSYPHHVKRSTLGGFVITAEFAGPSPYLIRLGLNDGAPPMVFEIRPNHAGPFVPGDKDGHYYRTSGWKCDRPGIFRPFAELIENVADPSTARVFLRVEGDHDVEVVSE